MPVKFLNLLKSLYTHSRAQVRTYGQTTHSFCTQSVVRQGCPISPFIFNFAVEALLQTALTNASYSGIDLLPGGRLANLEYADDMVLF